MPSGPCRRARSRCWRSSQPLVRLGQVAGRGPHLGLDRHRHLCLGEVSTRGPAGMGGRERSGPAGVRRSRRSRWPLFPAKWVPVHRKGHAPSEKSGPERPRRYRGCPTAGALQIRARAPTSGSTPISLRGFPMLGSTVGRAYLLDPDPIERPRLRRRPRSTPATALLDAYSACRDRRRRPRRPRRGAGRDPHARTARGARRRRLRRHHCAGRPRADQQPCGRRRARIAADRFRRPRDGGAAARRRPRHRPRADPRRFRAQPADRAARRFQGAAARPARGRDRQSARLRIDRDRGRDLRARPLAARADRAA